VTNDIAQEEGERTGGKVMKFDLSKAMLVVAAACAICVPAGFAQTSTTTTTTTNPPTINQRKDNQQERIGNGVENGSLTAGETRSLERQEADVNKEEHQMRALDNGKLTKGDRAVLNQQQNHLSKEIYQDKHNAAVQNYKGEVGARQRNQQERIGQGIKSGQLTAGEAAHLENQQAHLNGEVKNMRAMNGGKLTPGERNLVNHQENKTSKAIYNKKHNGRVR
jgi:hypothetical protein